MHSGGYDLRNNVVGMQTEKNTENYRQEIANR